MKVTTTLVLTALGLAVLAGGLLYGELFASRIGGSSVSGSSKADPYRGPGERTAHLGSRGRTAAVEDTAEDKVFFPRQKASVDTYLMALWRGELVLDGEGCLRVRGDGSLVPVWPPGFGVEISGEEVRILDERGRVVARVGDEVEIGGGEAPAAERIAALDERTKRDLRERCPGQYWLASPDVDVIRQG